ncbi:Undecaprenol kinase [Emticicia aquatica]|jgi:diacylglycerol kinase|uniref:Undecaprenol kinase n=1 Tax=Emticicia aquatica TaxID=1681835 RepID=A0ABM9APN6_9BACT|nr:diacylglycerol kinase family protein [Emticicia aquatica]CAH0995894.1 Undecaprenol kinase [Emticicia aquatica]
MQVLKMLRSFRYAIAGLHFLLAENNARFHLLSAIIVLLTGFYLKISAVEWTIIIMQIGLILAVETINTSIEKLCDFVSVEYHQLIGKVKDLAAAAVLIVSIVAVIVGIIIFLPKILSKF